MAETNLIALLFQAQSLHRKTPFRTRSRSRTRVLMDGREIRTGYHYDKRRKQVLKRDGGRCVRCGSTFNIQVHHDRKRSLLRDDRLENLITLCGDCHRKQHEE